MAGLLVPLDRWNDCLRVWLAWRRFLFRRWGIPTDFELHAQEFLRPSTYPVPASHRRANKVRDSGINTQEGQRHEVYRRSLETIRFLPGSRVFGTHREDLDRLATYRSVLGAIQLTMEADGAASLIMVDGADTRLRALHRQLDLDSRLVLEDSWHEDSAHSQFLQVADLIVHAGYQHVAQKDNRKFMWDWYPQQLGPVRIALSEACACGLDTH